MDQLAIQWTSFKVAYNRSGFKIYYVWDIFSYDSNNNPLTYEYRAVGSEGDRLYIAYVVSTDDISDFETSYKSISTQVGSVEDAIANIPPPINSEFVPRVELVPRIGKNASFGYTRVGYNLCDPTTWFMSYNDHTSSPVTLTNSGDNLTYTSGMSNWINIYDWNLVLQQYAQPSLSYQLASVWQSNGTFAMASAYNVTVIKNGVTQSSGYSINYQIGSVTFNSPNSPSDVIQAGFRQMADSKYIVRPPAGYKTVISHIEVNITDDVTVTTGVNFDIWGLDSQYRTTFPPAIHEYHQAYNSKRQIYAVANVGVAHYGATKVSNPTVPAAANNGWSTTQTRDLTNSMTIIPYDFGDPAKFGTAFELKSSRYEQLIVSLTSDAPFNGEYCSLTLFTQTELE